MAELITLEGKAQEKGKKVTGYKFPNNLEDLKFPFKLLFHPNYKIGLNEKIQTDRSVKYLNAPIKPTDAIFVAKNGNELITKEGYVLSSFDKNMIVISPEKISSDTNTTTNKIQSKESTNTTSKNASSNTTLEQDLNNSDLGKTARKIQIGFSVVGWGVFGILAYKFWNKSTTWKVMLSIFGAYNLYSTYKIFSKPALQVGDGSESETSTATKSVGSVTSTSTTSNTTSKIPDYSNLKKYQKIDLIIKNQSGGEQMDADDVNNSKAFLNTLNDSELNIWISLSKALKDDEVNNAMAKNIDNGFTFLQSKYGISRNDAEQQMKKLDDFMTKSLESAGFKVTENQSMFSNFESSLNLDL